MVLLNNGRFGRSPPCSCLEVLMWECLGNLARVYTRPGQGHFLSSDTVSMVTNHSQGLWPVCRVAVDYSDVFLKDLLFDIGGRSLQYQTTLTVFLSVYCTCTRLWGTAKQLHDKHSHTRLDPLMKDEGSSLRLSMSSVSETHPELRAWCANTLQLLLLEQVHSVSLVSHSPDLRTVRAPNLYSAIFSSQLRDTGDAWAPRYCLSCLACRFVEWRRQTRVVSSSSSARKHKQSLMTASERQTLRSVLWRTT